MRRAVPGPAESVVWCGHPHLPHLSPQGAGRTTGSRSVPAMAVMGDQRKKRPRDPVQLAKLIGDIATGQVEDMTEEAPMVARARKAGRRGGPARASALTPEQRSEIARTAAEARWKKAKK